MKMETPEDNYLRTIEKLQRELKARESDIQKAATIGKQLLEDKDKLRELLENTRLENESLKQDKYSLRLDLETKIQTVNTQSSELELQREEFDNLIKKYENHQQEITTQRKQMSNLKSEKYDLEKVLEDCQQANNVLKKRILSQERQIKEFQQRAELSANLTVIDDNLSEEADINFYRLQNQQLQEALSELRYELQSSKLEETRLTSLVEELQEGVQERDKEIKDYSVEIRKARDASSELQGEIEILKLQQLDVNRRGNSVFGELDDRRKLVEKEYKLLANQYQNVLKNYASNKEELTRCKGQLSIMMSMQSRSYQDAYIKELEDNLGSAKREIESLTVKLNRTIKLQQQSNTQKDMSKHDEYNYLRVLNQQAEKKIKDLQNEFMTLRLKNIAANEGLTTTQRFLYQTQEDLDAMKIENMKLKQEIKDLTVKPDSDVPTESKPRIEIIPGFVPNAESIKLLKTLQEKATKPKEEGDIIPGELLMGENGFQKVKSPKRSNRAILREWNTRKEHEESGVEKESGVEETDFLQEMNCNYQIDYEACKMKPMDKKYEPYVNKKQKDERCTQQ